MNCQLEGGHSQYISHPVPLLHRKKGNAALSYWSYKECVHLRDITDSAGKG